MYSDDAWSQRGGAMWAPGSDKVRGDGGEGWEARGGVEQGGRKTQVWEETSIGGMEAEGGAAGQEELFFEDELEFRVASY